MSTTHTTASQRLPATFILPIALGALLQALNSSMIALALVDIRHSFHAGASAAWLISGLYLATAVGAPTMGRLADMIGPRRVFLAGLAVIALAAAAAPFSPNIGTLIALRVLLGIGTSAPFPAGLAMIRAEADRRGMPNSTSGLGALAIAAQAAVALGPPLGGVLVALAGWPSIFWVNLPLTALSAALALRYLPSDSVGNPVHGIGRRLDPQGLLLFGAMMSALMLFLLSLQDSPQWWLVPVVPVLGVALVLRELRAPEPFLDVRFLAGQRALSATYLRTALTYVAFYSIFYVVPAWLEESRGLPPQQAGLMMLPLAIFGACSVAMATRLERRTGPRLPLVIGSAVLAAGSLTAALFGAVASLPLVLLLIALLGLPNGFNSLGNQTAMYRAAPPNAVGVASGLLRTSQYIGANLAAGLIEIANAGPASDAGLQRTMLAVSVICVLLLLAALASRHLRAASRPARLNDR